MVNHTLLFCYYHTKYLLVNRIYVWLKRETVSSYKREFNSICALSAIECTIISWEQKGTLMTIYTYAYQYSIRKGEKKTYPSWFFNLIF
jgi:hypothetical protein